MTQSLHIGRECPKLTKQTIRLMEPFLRTWKDGIQCKTKFNFVEKIATTWIVDNIKKSIYRHCETYQMSEQQKSRRITGSFTAWQGRCEKNLILIQTGHKIKKRTNLSYFYFVYTIVFVNTYVVVIFFIIISRHFEYKRYSKMKFVLSWMLDDKRTWFSIIFICFQ